MKKVLLLGLLSGAVMLVLGMAISYLFMISPQVRADYYDANIMRPWSDPVMSLYFLYPFVLGVALAWFWNKAKGLFAGSWTKRGFSFGVLMLVISVIPGMLVSYSSFPLSLLTIISWLVGGFVNAVVAGMIFAKWNG
ncbi:MAG: hypothetical protein PHU56_03025 [Candidatus Pacebacteria bacterium]|nr:hypothetical protein [Candidatus Paceibacterota bacterium]